MTGDPTRRGLMLAGLGALAPAVAWPATPDLFAAWRKMYASAANEEIYWWFFGVIDARVSGHGDIPAVRTEAVRVCRVTATDDQVSMVWKEIGAYLDRATGRPIATWSNPLTHKALPVARAFEEGVGTYAMNRSGALSLKQRWARPWRTDATVAQAGGRLILAQDEMKTRAFPYPDGESPDITEPNAVVNDFSFRISADRRQVEDPAVASARAAGRFTTLFGGAPSWMAFPGRVVRAVAHGTMHKTAASAEAFPQVRARLQALHPDYFRHGAISWD